MKQESHILKNESDISTAIPDDIEVVGPGRMLSEAREVMGLSQQQVADKLNFRITLVQSIETEEFDLNLPAAFNRGYLKNYAKLVNISQDDVLNSYDQLGVAQRQCDEMQSFSKGTEKQAEHNMLMWITYLILIALITATVVWWYQVPSTQPTAVSVNSVNDVDNTSRVITINDASANNNEIQKNEISTDDTAANEITDKLLPVVSDQVVELDVTELDTSVLTTTLDTPVSNETATGESNNEGVNSHTAALASLVNSSNTQENIAEVNVATIPAKLVFTFSGDCWVNIYDASGERVAWGVKKSGYVMRFSGQAPFKVTLGKPELVQIEYNDTVVDMTGFNAGNIAKFSLPLKP
jgi:cytoskeleton protein RodZ